MSTWKAQYTEKVQAMSIGQHMQQAIDLLADDSGHYNERQLKMQRATVHIGLAQLKAAGYTPTR